MAKKITNGAVGAAALAAAAAGTYWLYGAKDASKHRKAAKSWMLKARAEVLEGVEKAIEKAGTIDKEKYVQLVKAAVKNYSSTKAKRAVKKAKKAAKKKR